MDGGEKLSKTFEKTNKKPQTLKILQTMGSLGPVRTNTQHTQIIEETTKNPRNQRRLGEAEQNLSRKPQKTIILARYPSHMNLHGGWHTIVGDNICLY